MSCNIKPSIILAWLMREQSIYIQLNCLKP